MLDMIKNMNRKTLMIFGGLLGLVVIILIVALIMFIFGGEDGYTRLKKSMIAGAEEYINDNEPPELGEQMRVTLDMLITGEYVREVTKYVDDNCTGHVVIMNNNGLLNFLPFLSCDDYKTETLANRIINDNLIENPESEYESGLYYIDGQLFFRGEKTNNYLHFGNVIWRIVRIDANGDIRLVKETPAEETWWWDAKFNYERGRAVGINDFRYSDLLAGLVASYEDFQEVNRRRIIPHDVCIGRVDSIEAAVDLERDCSELLLDQYISVLSVSEIPMASLDPKCTTLRSGNCANFNYFFGGGLTTTWTSTALSTNTFSVIRATAGDSFATNASSRNRFHWVLHISGLETFVSGTGTLNDPYIIE